MKNRISKGGVSPLVYLAFALILITVCCCIGQGQASHIGETSSDDSRIGMLYATLVPTDSVGGFDLNEEFPVTFEATWSPKEGTVDIGGIMYNTVGRSLLTVSSEGAVSQAVTASVSPTASGESVSMSICVTCTRGGLVGSPILLSSTPAELFTFTVGEATSEDVTLTFYERHTGTYTDRQRSSLSAGFSVSGDDLTMTTSAPDGGFDISERFPVRMNCEGWSVRGEQSLVYSENTYWKVGTCDVDIRGTVCDADLYMGVTISMNGAGGTESSGINVYARIQGQSGPPICISDTTSEIGSFQIEPEEGEIVAEKTLTVELYCDSSETYSTAQLRSMTVSSELYAVAEL